MADDGGGGGGVCLEEDWDEHGGHGEGGADADAEGGPKKAVAVAHQQDSARVSLHRVLRTLVQVFALRGLDPVRIGRREISVGAGVEVLQDAVDGQNHDYESMEAAEEVVMIGEVSAHAPRYTTAHALQQKPGGRVLVLVFHDQVSGKVKIADKVRHLIGCVRAMPGVIYTILVHRQMKLKSQTVKALSTYRDFVQSFSFAELQRCIAFHTAVPPHLPLSSAEVAAARMEYPGIWPKLKTSDPMVKLLRLPAGVVVASQEGREPVRYYEVVDAGAA